MITLNESSLSGLVHISVTNNWIMYRIEGTAVIKKATRTFQHPTMWMGCQNKKGIGSFPDPFGVGAYTASDKRPAPNSSLAM